MRNSIGSKKIISVVLTALILLFTTKVYAATDRFNTTLHASSQEVKREEIVTITIGLKDIAISSGEKGIGAYTANIKFDSSVLEYVSTNSTSKWEAPFYKDGLITGNTKDGEVINTTQNIGTITFKVKRNAKLGDTTIELTNFSGSTAETDVDASNTSIKLKIVDNNNENNNNQNDGNNNTGNNNNQNGGNNNNGNNNNQNGGNNNTGNNNNQNGGNSNTNNTQKPGDNNNGNNGGNGNNANNNNQNTGNSNNANNNNNGSVNSNNVDNTITKDVLPQTGATNKNIYILIVVCALAVIIFLIRMLTIDKK